MSYMQSQEIRLTIRYFHDKQEWLYHRHKIAINLLKQAECKIVHINDEN